MKIGILGSGALGISLAINFNKNQNIENILIYSRKQEVIEDINNHRKSIFPNIQIPDKASATNDLFQVLTNSEIIFITVNSNSLKNVLDQIAFVKEQENINLVEKFFIICSKGIDKSGKFFHELAVEILKSRNIGLFLGPSFANEIAHGETTIVNLVHEDSEKAEEIISKLVDSQTNVKIIPISDYIGAQICTIMKNICAIYLGIARGLGAKNDYLSILFTSFIQEIRRAITFYHGDPKTIFELCGIGDLFLTCTSFESRNYSFGYQIGLTKSVKEAFTNCNDYYPEGYYGLKNFYNMNVANGLQLDICKKLYNLIFIDEKVTEKLDLHQMEYFV